MMGGTDDTFKALDAMVQATFGETRHRRQTREVIVLRAAGVLICPSEWQPTSKWPSTHSEVDDEAPLLRIGSRVLHGMADILTGNATSLALSDQE